MAEFDSNNVRYLYANNGNFVTSFNDRGARNDFSNPPINMEATIYLQGGSDDDMSPKLRGGRHTDSDSCAGCCYIPGLRTSGGVHYRVECPHPDYHDCSGSSQGSAIGYGSWVGTKAIVWNTSSNCVHIELWQDKGNSSSSPANQWEKVWQDEDCSGKCGLSNCGGGPLLRPRSDSSQFTWRNDGNPSKKWISLVEISPGATTGGTTGSPIPGGTGSPTSPTDGNGTLGDGGGGGGNDRNTGTGGTGATAYAAGGCAVASAGGVTAIAGTCNSGGGGGNYGTGRDLLPSFSPGTAPTPAGGATEPRPFVTVFKDVGFLYNIRTDLFDNCAISGDPNVTSFKEVYNVAGLADEYVLLFQNSSTEYYGLKLHSTKSALFGKKVRKVSVTLNRANPDATLSGDIYMEIRDIMGHLVYEFEDVLDSATVSLDQDTQYDFEALDNTHKMEAGDMILIRYNEGGDAANHIKVLHSPEEAVDGFNTVYVESQSGIEFDVDQLADAAFIVYI